MKILIVDDEPIKIELFEAFLSANCLSYNLDSALSANVFRSKLKTEYDIVLCDVNLAGENGEPILYEYETAWPDSVCLLYSGSATSVNLTVPRIYKCYSLDSVKTQLLLYIISITGGMTMPQPAPRTVPTFENVNGSRYNKELCETLHDQNEKDHIKMIDDNHKDHVLIHESIKNVGTSVNSKIGETREDNKKIFQAVLSVVFTNIVTSLAVITFMFMLLSKIKP